MTNREKFDVAATAVITLSAVALLGLYVYDRSTSDPPSGSQTYADGWEDWEAAAISFGASDPTMTVSVFWDFTCPYCRRLAPVLDSLRNTYPADVQIQLIHYVWPTRELAVSSAIAAECAAQQGAFEPLYSKLTSEATTLDQGAWDSYARDSGIPDLSRFMECMELPPEDFDRIDIGRELAASHGVRGTPTIWVNGWRFDRGRTLATLKERAEELGVN